MIENTISIDSTVNMETQPDKFEDIDAAENHADVQNNNAEENSFFEQSAKHNEQSEQENTNPEADEIFELNIYGKTVTVPKKEAVAAAQRGLAFDEMKGRLATAKNDARIKMLENIAADSGQTVTQLLTQLNTDRAMEKLVQKYGDIYSVPVQEMAGQVHQLELAARDIEDAVSDWQVTEKLNQLQEFLNENPGCLEIPPQVIQQAKNGKNLALAYSQHKAQQLEKELTEVKKELNILKAHKKAKEKSMPPLQSNSFGGATNSVYGMMKSMW